MELRDKNEEEEEEEDGKRIPIYVLDKPSFT